MTGKNLFSKLAGITQRIGIHDRSKYKPLCRRKSDLMNDSASFVSSLAPPLRLKICYTVYHNIGRSLVVVICCSAAEEKAHGASGHWSGSFLQRGEGAKMPRNPSLGRFTDNIKICIGFYNIFLFSVITFWM